MDSSNKHLLTLPHTDYESRDLHALLHPESNLRARCIVDAISKIRKLKLRDSKLFAQG